MKLAAVAWILSISLVGCGWNDFWSQFDHGHGGRTPGGGSTPRPPTPSSPTSKDVLQFEAVIEHSPSPKVSLVSYAHGAEQERGVRAELAQGQAVDLSAADPQEIEQALDDGTLSLLDVFLIARAIKTARFQLTDGSVAGSAADEQMAKQLHDALLQTVHTRTADCHALCTGDTSACGSRRSFGGGAPCTLGGQPQDKIGGHFGATWCVSDFCPALSQAKE